MTTIHAIDLGDLVRNLAAEPHNWLDRVRLSVQERWYERLRYDADHEVWLISWMPGQSTGFHDHGGSRGAFAVAYGELTEHDTVRGRSIRAGQWRQFGSDYVHDVRNVSTAPAVSVHVYSPPLTVMNRYDLSESGLIKLPAEKQEQW